MGQMWVKCEDKFEARFIEQTNSIGKGRYNCRRLEELPYQCCKQNDKNFVKDYLFDHKWVFDKLCGSSVYQVLEDVCLAPSDCAISNDISWLRSFLEMYSSALGHDGRQFFTLLGAPDVPKLASSQLCVAWAQIALDPPIPCLAILPSSKAGDKNETTSNEGSEQTTSTSSNEKFFDNIYRLPKNPDFVVTISAEREEICVWDIHKCMRVRTLRKVTQPITLEMIDDYRCVVLCKRELRTYDLNTGVLLTKLKGVMNQKMPYYGLHDPSHLVALSRNRMYVNLMNLDTGDLVTTFKAGEDRFLNSLLVSGDGRVLVCGDETQKPFPLLVWNLASRKLLYDLRIPHHDFLTHLAAITYEGHYVCCVTKEVDEPAPNFIVVYDLQSGTLFKKWKSGVNCVSLDISSKDGCVLSGHEDGRILLWDLVTGNCRCKLTGHSGPVSCLRLDPKGGAFLSYDVECRDRSMRLWNITTGEQSAVFTPDRRITACEITAGGQFVVMATEGSNQLITLQLVGPGRPRMDSSKAPVGSAYSLVEKTGKVFDLEDR